MHPCRAASKRRRRTSVLGVLGVAGRRRAAGGEHRGRSRLISQARTGQFASAFPRARERHADQVPDARFGRTGAARRAHPRTPARLRVAVVRVGDTALSYLVRSDSLPRTERETCVSTKAALAVAPIACGRTPARPCDRGQKATRGVLSGLDIPDRTAYAESRTPSVGCRWRHRVRELKVASEPDALLSGALSVLLAPRSRALTAA